MKNACVVGYGNIGHIHAELLENSQYARLYAVCDIAPEVLSDVKVKTYTDYEDVLADSAIDTVHICTPHYLHVPMAIGALRAGKKVVIEKPVAMNEEQWESLSHLSGAKDICCVLQNRHNPCIEKLSELCKNPKSIFGALTWQRDSEYYKSGDWRGKWATEGGGVVINQAVHLLDLMLLFGGDAASVTATISNKSIPEIEVEDTADALIEFKSGARGIFFATNAYNTNSPMRLEIETEDALYRYSDGFLCRIGESGVEILARDKVNVLGKPYWGSGHEKVFCDFYSYLETGRGSFISLRDAARVMHVMYAIYQSEGKRREL